MRRGRVVLHAWAAVVIAYLFAPILVMIAFSFNAPRGRFNVVWRQFSLQAWLHPFAVSGLAEALWVSAQVAAIATAAATVAGTLLAIGLVRRRVRGRSAVDLLLVLPLTTPDVVLGASLLSLFLAVGVPVGFWTIVAAHVMVAVAYVTLTVAARLRGLDARLEEAAMDLGADEWRTLRTVTLPLLAPAIGAAALLAFALSVDDFTMTLFVSGSRVTFPLYVWGAARVAVPPQINVLGTSILALAVGCLLVATVLGRRDAAA